MHFHLTISLALLGLLISGCNHEPLVHDAGISSRDSSDAPHQYAATALLTVPVSDHHEDPPVEAAADQPVATNDEQQATADNPNAKATELRIKVDIDGRDELRLCPTHATWTHATWNRPTVVDMNGVQWTLVGNAELRNAGDNRYVAADVDWGRSEVVVHHGRGQVSLTQDEHRNAVIIFDDPAPGADVYDVTIRFNGGGSPPASVPTEVAVVSVGAAAGDGNQARAQDDAPGGKTETVTLADGSQVEVDVYGNKHLAYEFREPVLADDWKETLKPIWKVNPGVTNVLEYRNRGLPGDRQLRAFRLDATRGKMYWIDFRSGRLAGTIRRANLDGSNLEAPVEMFGDPQGLALDLKNQKMYWSVAGGDGNRIQRADFDGAHVDDVVTGIETPSGLAVDPEHNHLYYAIHGGMRRIFRSRLDGSERTLIADKAGGWQLFLHEKHEKLYWTQAGSTIQCCNLDGTHLETAVNVGDGFGHIWGFDIHVEQEKLYWNNSYGHIRRANLDGSQIEDVVVGTYPHQVAGIAIDPLRGTLFWAEAPLHNDVTNYGRIRRVDIPPIAEAMEPSPPPKIVSVAPLSQSAGKAIRIEGTGFATTTQVLFIGIGIGECAEAQYNILSNETIEVTVPLLRSPCRDCAIAVRGTLGLTVTMPKVVVTIDGIHHESRFLFDAFAANQQFSLIVNPNCEAGGLERCLVYVAPGGWASFGPEGKNVLFLKSGSRVVVSTLKKSTIFHEPFALVNLRDQLPADTKLIPVLAIRPSFVDELFRISENAG